MNNQSEDYYFKLDNEVEGPFTWDELRYLAGQGQINSDYMVRKGGSGIWETAESHRGLVLPFQEITTASVTAENPVRRRGIRSIDSSNKSSIVNFPDGLPDNQSPSVMENVKANNNVTRRQWIIISVSAIAAFLLTLVLLLLWFRKPADGEGIAKISFGSNSQFGSPQAKSGTAKSSSTTGEPKRQEAAVHSKSTP